MPYRGREVQYQFHFISIVDQPPFTDWSVVCLSVFCYIELESQLLAMAVNGIKIVHLHQLMCFCVSYL